MDTVKRSLIMFFLGLPVILICVVFFLGFGLGNAGLLFLSAGQIVLVPLAVTLCHMVTGLLPTKYFDVTYSDIGQLVPSAPLTANGTKINVWPSYWMAHFSFFCSYILVNAYAVYTLDPVSDSPDYTVKVNNRKSRAIVIMMFMLATFLILSGIRLAYTDSEKFFGAIFATVIFGLLGWGWCTASKTLGIRTMDIFGVAQQMVLTQDPSKPTTCVTTSA